MVRMYVRRLAAAVVVLLAAALAVALPAAPASADPTPAESLTTAFGSYGDSSGAWAGGDGTVSVPLPDGRVAWFFSDTLVGAVNADHSLPTATTMVNNTIVVQDGALLSTIVGGTAQAPEAVVTTGVAGEYYWINDAVVEGNQVTAIYSRMRATGSGVFGFEFMNSAIATFSLPSLSLVGVANLPAATPVAWGASLLEDGQYTYIYGSEQPSVGGLKFAHLARAPLGAVTGPWHYWDGAGWSADPTDSVQLVSGVNTTFGIQVVGGAYVLVTVDENIPFTGRVVAYTSPAPTGPFSGPIELYAAPEQATSEASLIVYNAQLHPHQASAGTLLISYDVNALELDQVRADVRRYRPRFIEVDWPRPVPDPSLLPPAPTGLVATGADSGIVSLTWTPQPDVSFTVYQRDVTSGQTHFSRVSQWDGNSAEVGLLTTGRTYEFRVTATNSAGESAPSAAASALVTLAPPAAPTDVTAVADDETNVTVSWSPVPDAWLYDVYRRDLSAGEDVPIRANGSAVSGQTTSYEVTGLVDQHQYEFTVVAQHGGGTSPHSTPATATANLAPPAAPTGLTAVANPDGTVTYSWTAPEPDIWYWLYRRDVTAGETEFIRLSLPIATCCSTVGDYMLHNHQYEFKIAGNKRGKEGPTSNVASVTVVYPVPTAPTELTATAGNGKAELSWSSTETRALYRVYQRNVTAGEPEFTRLPLPASCCTMTAGYLTNGQTYEFKVTAYNQADESAVSNTVQVTPQGLPPGPVTDLTATANADGSITIDFVPPGPNVWFNIYMRDVTAGEPGFTKLPLPLTSCCTMTATVLTHAHVYEFQVAATTSGGEGPRSNVASATSTFPLPGAPIDLRGASSGNGMIALDWDRPAPKSYYYWIYWRDVTAGQTTFSRSVYPISNLSVVFGPFTHGHVIEFQITAHGQAGEGPPSAPVQVTAVGSVPQPASNLTAVAGDGQAFLQWTISPTAGAWYWVYMRNKDTGESWQKLPLPVTTSSVTIGYLANGTTYEFKVVAYNAAGESAPTNVVAVKPLPPLPSPPTNVVATAGDRSVHLTWTASATPNVHYWIYQKPAGGAWVRLPLPLTSCCSFNGGYLANGTNYSWYVVAANLAGESAPSNTVSRTPMPPLPQAPTITEWDTDDGAVTLTWSTTPTYGEEYWIRQRDESAGGTWQELPYPISSCCTFNGGWLINGHTYAWQVRAQNLSGSSAWSNVVTGVPMPPVPHQPKNVAVNVQQGTVTVSWDPSGNTTSVEYQVELRQAGLIGWDLWWQRPSTTSATISLRSYRGELYEFRVRAVNIAGMSLPTAASKGFVSDRPDYRHHSQNDLNGANAIGVDQAAGMMCENRGFQRTCYGSLFNGRPKTIGDYLFYGGLKSELNARLWCEAHRRADIRWLRNVHGYSDANAEQYANDYGEDLLRHEEMHSIQWAGFAFASQYAYAYGMASAYSFVATGNEYEENIFELAANLYNGGYWSLDDVTPHYGLSANCGRYY